MELSAVSQRMLAPKKEDVSGVHTNQAMKNPRDKDHPDRPLLLSVAENVLCWEHLKPRIDEFCKLHEYDNMYSPSYDGRSYMKECCAKFLSSYVFNAPVVPEDIIVVDGSGAVMDIMGTALLNPSIDGKPADAFICITPCYNAFNNNFTLRNDAVMYKADITATNYVITEEVLEKAYQEAVKDGRKVKMLVFTNPNNPIGTVYTREEMLIVLNFCRKHNIHLFADEIYALSVKPASAMKEGDRPFISFAQILENDPKKDDVTILWGFSKDIGLSGFRLSVLVTKNQDLHTVLNELCHFCEAPSMVQSFATNMLGNESFMKEHVALLQKRVYEMRLFVEKEFRRMKVPFSHGDAGFFSWLNLREYLEEDSYEGELELYNYIYEHGNIIIAPGYKYNSPEYGWYRWIFTCYEEEEMMLALKGLERALQQRKHKRDHAKINSIVC